MKADRFWWALILIPWKHKAKKQVLVTSDLSHLELLQGHWTDVGDDQMRLWVHSCSKTILTPNCCLPYESFEHFMVLYNYPKFQEYIIFFAKEIRNKILKSIYWFGYPQGI